MQDDRMVDFDVAAIFVARVNNIETKQTTSFGLLQEHIRTHAEMKQKDIRCKLKSFFS
jgi:hypothetical protein